MDERYGVFVDSLVTGAKGYCQLAKIGSVSKFPLYKCIINPKKKDAICFLGGIHGNEPAGSLAILKFIESHPQLKQKVVLLPVANPYGFSHGIRRNHEGIDINRHFFDKPLCKHNKIIWNAFKDEDISLMCTLHEDPRHKSFYIYYTDNKPLVEQIRNLASYYFTIERKRDVYGDNGQGGLIGLPHEQTNCFEDRIYKEKGINYLAIELPGRATLDLRVECAVEIIKMILCGD